MDVCVCVCLCLYSATLSSKHKHCSWQNLILASIAISLSSLLLYWLIHFALYA